MTRFSRLLTRLLQDQALTVAKVHRGVVADGVDITYSAVFRWFNGESRPDLGQFKVLAHVLNLSGAEVIDALRVAAEDIVIGPTPTDHEPDPTVAPTPPDLAQAA